MCLHTKDTSTGQPTAGRSKLPSAAGVFRKNENFQQKNFDIFLIFGQNIDCGYTLEPPRQGGSNEYMFS